MRLMLRPFSLWAKLYRWSLVFALVLPSAGVADRLPNVAAIASAHPLASAAGLDVLAAGGNAFDAAVAVSAALAVVEPYGSGMGGGGFWLLHRQRDALQVMVDGRETAPSAASRNMYLDASGDVRSAASIDGPLAAGIPGQPAALVHIAERYGALPLRVSLAPAVRLANQGFAVDEEYRRMARLRLDVLRSSKDAARIFLDQGQVPALGHIVKQPELASTLERLADQGRDGFYRGEIARRLVADVRKAGGIWRCEDLATYRVIERRPIYGEYRGYRIVAAPPPSSGGVALITMLNLLADYPLHSLDEPDRVHYLAESMRRAYRDRARYLGDPDVVDVPVDHLISAEHASALAADIRLDRATPSQVPVPITTREGHDTTHFSIIDRAGNRVAATLSINYPFGSGFVAAGTGVLLNDEMDDFSAKPGVPNVYGLVGAEANAIAPGKRMLSSMSPTFVEGPGGVGVLGTPGGSRIITMVLLGILDLVDGNPPSSWVARRRFHHQYLPDAIQFEPGALNAATQTRLRAKGHTLREQAEPWGDMQALLWRRRTGEVLGASDPRGQGHTAMR